MWNFSASDMNFFLIEFFNTKQIFCCCFFSIRKAGTISMTFKCWKYHFPSQFRWKISNINVYFGLKTKSKWDTLYSTNIFLNPLPKKKLKCCIFKWNIFKLFCSFIEVHVLLSVSYYKSHQRLYIMLWLIYSNPVSTHTHTQ